MPPPLLFRLAIGQMTATGSHAANVETARALCELASEAGATMLALPECFAFIGSNASETLAQATTLKDAKFEAFQKLAKSYGLWLSCGGFHEKDTEDANKVVNSHVVLNKQGDVVDVYKKMHLFDVAIPGGAVLMESKTTNPGPARCAVVDVDGVKIGLTTCYDLRFPELYAALAAKGADVLLVPSAFTVPTGRAHWHLLLRARAVETQCYVAAPAQVGRHNEKRESYGHALGVDPWGDVLVDAGDASPTVVCIDVDQNKLANIRRRMPIANHRRFDVVDLLSNALAVAHEAHKDHKDKDGGE
mmetsp:Transcript_32769/g.104459  ORF Transcript_32769/g.104459 Transcript_32769/m.104459 type:complete len:303 (-) Transcript_32769:1122-2030(-)